jgi:flagellar biosynthesis protein FliQ
VSSDALLDLWREALTVLLAVSAPFLIATLVVGLAVAILQTATQLQENVLTFIPKLGAAMLVIALAGHWALDKLGTFAISSFTAHAERSGSGAGPLGSMARGSPPAAGPAAAPAPAPPLAP